MEEDVYVYKYIMPGAKSNSDPKKKKKNNKEYRPLISISTQARNFDTLFFVVIVFHFVFC